MLTVLVFLSAKNLLINKKDYFCKLHTLNMATLFARGIPYPLRYAIVKEYKVGNETSFL